MKQKPPSRYPHPPLNKGLLLLVPVSILVIIFTRGYLARHLHKETLREMAGGFAVITIVLVAMGIFLWSIRWGLIQDEKQSHR